MKLYAMTKSERATSSQGGNDYLNIVVYGKNRQPLFKMIITPTGEEYEFKQLFYTTKLKPMKIKGEKATT